MYTYNIIPETIKNTQVETEKGTQCIQSFFLKNASFELAIKNYIMQSDRT